MDPNLYPNSTAWVKRMLNDFQREYRSGGLTQKTIRNYLEDIAVESDFFTDGKFGSQVIVSFSRKFCDAETNHRLQWAYNRYEQEPKSKKLLSKPENPDATRHEPVITPSDGPQPKREEGLVALASETGSPKETGVPNADERRPRPYKSWEKIHPLFEPNEDAWDMLFSSLEENGCNEEKIETVRVVYNHPSSSDAILQFSSRHSYRIRKIER